MNDRSPLSDKGKEELADLYRQEQITEGILRRIQDRIASIRHTCLHHMEEVAPELNIGYKKCTHCGQIKEID